MLSDTGYGNFERCDVIEIGHTVERLTAGNRAISASRGTKDCLTRAIEAGIPTYVIGSEPTRPKLMRAGDAMLF